VASKIRAVIQVDFMEFIIASLTNGLRPRRAVLVEPSTNVAISGDALGRDTELLIPRCQGKSPVYRASNQHKS